MADRLAGCSNLRRELQLKKQFFGMAFRLEFGEMLTVFKLEQNAKDHIPKELTVFGNEIDVKEVQLWNALSPMETIPEGILILFRF
jgi:hypothetical protein